LLASGELAALIAGWGWTLLATDSTRRLPRQVKLYWRNVRLHD
jgi:hypothetical protein